MATDSGMHRSSQLKATGGVRTRFPGRRDRWVPARPEGRVLGSAGTESRAIPVEAAEPLPVGQVPLASEDTPTRLPRPILWLAFTGWVVCCAMLFISLVQREPTGGRDGAWDATPLLVATVSAALETVFGEPDARAGRGPNDSAGSPSSHLE